MVNEDPWCMTAERVDNHERNEFLPSCDNPNAFVTLIRDVYEYQKQLKARVERATKVQEKLSETEPWREKATEEEFRIAFEGTPAFKKLFWDFDRDVVHLSYNPSKVPADFVSAFEEYLTSIGVASRAIRKDISTAEYKDIERSLAHEKAAKVLLNTGVVDSLDLGLLIVRAFLVDLKKVDIESAREADFSRTTKGMSREAATKFMLTYHEDGSSTFSHDRMGELQDYFAREYSGICAGREVRRVDYLDREVKESQDNFDQSGG